MIRARLALAATLLALSYAPAPACDAVRAQGIPTPFAGTQISGEEFDLILPGETDTHADRLADEGATEL